jgi:antitoxin ParD1/3/4
MNVSLTPRLVNYVRQKVDAGLYGSSSEVIRDALRLLEARDSQREAELIALRGDDPKKATDNITDPVDMFDRLKDVVGRQP